MPFLDYNTLYTCIQFRCNTEMPSMIYEACKTTGTRSQTVYIQHAVMAALARDLDRDEDELLAMLPRPKTMSACLFPPDRFRGSRHPSPNPGRIGSANTIEDAV